MKNLENYKNEIRNRISLLVILCILALFAMLVGNFYLKGQFPGKEYITDYVVGFFTGLEIVSLVFMGMLISAYRNDSKLLKMYTKETDEREMLIKLKSGANIVPVFSMLIVIASLIVAYVSYEAFLAMLAVAFVQIIVSFVLKIYWSRKI